MNLLPLLALWAWNRRQGGGSGTGLKPPPWPTTSSPPPVPAFAPGPAATAHAPAHNAETATPLATLHAHSEAPAATPAHPSDAIPKHTRTPTKAVTQAAHTAAKKAAHSALQKAVAKVPSIPHPTSGASLKAVTVADLQAILINRGQKLTHDGLYGPKTASAWSALAKQKGLPTSITRVGPKIARVAAQTYDALAVPAIP